MDLFLYSDLLTILAISIAILLIGYRIHLPPLVGLLLTGILVGPHGFGLVGDSGDVDKLAELGIVLLLFGIGMEFSFSKLVQIKRLFLLGGGLQVGFTILFSLIIAKLFGGTWSQALFLGFLLSMSSTVVVLRILEQTGESQSPHGKISISILIFQDMVAIPMILLTPLLGGQSGQAFDSSALWTLFKGVVILGGVFICAQYIVPRLLHLVARTRNKELFLVTVLSLCFGVAFFTFNLGLSLTIGAFLAGLIISESEYSNEALSNIFPFQALFISFFFVSIGMLLDLNFFFKHPILIISLALGVILLKTIAAGLTTIILGFPIRTAVITGILLSQIGEFSFVLAKTGMPFGLMTEELYQFFLSVSLITLGLSPFRINYASKIADLVRRLPLPQSLLSGYSREAKNEERLKNHILIIGFGISGKNLARSSKLAGIPYTILEMNPDTVREQKQLGEPIHYGDASHINVLEHLNIQEAKAVAVLINDHIAAKRVVQLARSANPSLYIIVRTRYVQETTMMRHLGADEVIPDEFGTSIEIFSRVLRQYFVPDDEINKFIHEIRSDGYDLLRNQESQPQLLADLKLNLSNVHMSSFRLHENSPLIGQSLLESQLRQQYGLSVLLIKRGSEVLSNPTADTVLLGGDIIVVVSEKTHMNNAAKLFGMLQTV